MTLNSKHENEHHQALKKMIVISNLTLKSKFKIDTDPDHEHNQKYEFKVKV